MFESSPSSSGISWSALSILMFVLLGSTGVVRAGVEASSFMVVSNKAETAYGAANLIDRDLGSVWIEGKEGPGIEESFTIDLPPCVVKKVAIFPGHGEDERMFNKYAHLKEVSVSFFTLDNDRKLKAVKQQNFVFENAFKFQEIPVEGVKLGDELFGGRMTVTIRSVYPGIDFQDTAVGEVKVILDEFPAQQAIREASPPKEGFKQDNLIDGSPSTLWVTETKESPYVLINAPDYGLAALTITSGDITDPKKYKEYARPKEIQVEVDNQSVTFILKDEAKVQRLDLPAKNGFTGAFYGNVRITVKSVYPGAKSQDLGISDIQMIATNYVI